MRKILIQIVACLLVPVLIADPVIASGLENLFIPTLRIILTPSPRFSEQALTEKLVAAWTAVNRIASREQSAEVRVSAPTGTKPRLTRAQELAFLDLQAAVERFSKFPNARHYKWIVETCLPVLGRVSLGKWDAVAFDAFRKARSDLNGGFKKGFLLLWDLERDKERKFTGRMVKIPPKLIRDNNIDTRLVEIHAYEQKHSVTVELGDWYSVVTGTDLIQALYNKMHEETNGLWDALSKTDMHERRKEFFTQAANLADAMQRLMELKSVHNVQPSAPAPVAMISHAGEHVVLTHLLSSRFVRYYEHFRNQVNPKGLNFTIVMGGAGADVSSALLLSDFTLAYFIDQVAVKQQDLIRFWEEWNDPVESQSGYFRMKSGTGYNYPVDSQSNYFHTKFDVGYALSPFYAHENRPALGYWVIQELKALGITKEGVRFLKESAVLNPATKQPYPFIEFQLPGEQKWRKIVFLHGDLFALGPDIDPILRGQVDLYIEKAVMNLASFWRQRAVQVTGWIKPGGSLIVNPIDLHQAFYNLSEVLAPLGFVQPAGEQNEDWNTEVRAVLSDKTPAYGRELYWWQKSDVPKNHGFTFLRTLLVAAIVGLAWLTLHSAWVFLAVGVIVAVGVVAARAVVRFILKDASLDVRKAPFAIQTMIAGYRLFFHRHVVVEGIKNLLIRGSYIVAANHYHKKWAKDFVAIANLLAVVAGRISRFPITTARKGLLASLGRRALVHYGLAIPIPEELGPSDSGKHERTDALVQKLMINNHGSIIMTPKGGADLDPNKQLENPRKGVGWIALLSGCPIIPIAISGPYSKHPIMRVGEPILPEGTAEEIVGKWVAAMRILMRDMPGYSPARAMAAAA